MKKLTNKQIKAIIATGATTKTGSFNKTLELDRHIKTMAEGGKARTIQTVGAGSRTRYVNVRGVEAAAKILEACRYKAIRDNDATRGGQYGEYCKLARKVAVSASAIEDQAKAFLAK